MQKSRSHAVKHLAASENRLELMFSNHYLSRVRQRLCVPYFSTVVFGIDISFAAFNLRIIISNDSHVFVSKRSVFSANCNRFIDSINTIFRDKLRWQWRLLTVASGANASFELSFSSFGTFTSSNAASKVVKDSAIAFSSVGRSLPAVRILQFQKKKINQS